MMYEYALSLLLQMSLSLNLLHLGEPKKTALWGYVFFSCKIFCFLRVESFGFWIVGLHLNLKGNLKVLQNIKPLPVHRGPGTFGENVDLKVLLGNV